MSGQLTLDLAAAMQARDFGLDLVEAANLSFVSLMRKAAQAICAKQGWVTSDDLRVLAEQWGLKPDHPNSWGAVFRGKGWHVVGRRASAVESNHSREVKVWVYTEETSH